MRAKFKYRLSEKITGVLTIQLDVSNNVREAAEVAGHSKEEIENLIGQEFQTVIELLALDEPA
jgi:hypothetical protein